MENGLGFVGNFSSRELLHSSPELDNVKRVLGTPIVYLHAIVSAGHAFFGIRLIVHEVVFRLVPILDQEEDEAQYQQRSRDFENLGVVGCAERRPVPANQGCAALVVDALPARNPNPTDPRR